VALEYQLANYFFFIVRMLKIPSVAR